MEINATPMLKQYREIKNKNPDCILFFRLGDFYEMFFDDAKAASRELDIVLTSRGKTPAGKIPMCGFPHHAAENYIAKLIKAGHKVAICEQLEDPALACGIVKRGVVRIITSGTFLDENNPAPRYLVCISPNSKNIGIAFTDPAIGTILTNQYPDGQKHLTELIANLPVFECIYPQAAEEAVKSLFKNPLLGTKNITLSPCEDWCFNPDIARKSICEHFAVHNLHGFSIEEKPSAISSAGALLEYLKQMNKQPLRHIDKISLYTDDKYAFISPAAYRGLELESLIKTTNNTLTPMGKRKFRFWLLHPLKQPAKILQRQQAVSLLKDNPHVLKELRCMLNKIPDIEKNISRLSCGYTNVKDLLAIKNTLTMIPEIIKTIAPLQNKNPLFELHDITDLRQGLNNSINQDVPLSHFEGKFIKKGFHQQLDALRDIQENGRQWLKNLQEQEIKRSGINSLKIGFNKIFGYYIEITRTNLNSVPENYIRKQTLVNAERFITPELKKYENKILNAQEEILKIEDSLIKKIRDEILDNSIELHNLCQNIATLDVIHSLSVLASSQGYVMPEITDGTTLHVEEGRHPVVELTSTEPFIPNNTYLDCDENHLVILTGPNMAGKSTYIRQIAVLVIMAQMGSFIPVKSARIGVVDKIFTRIGAHDDISKGQSTFMVEMNEAADILNNLTDKSLIILDEIGRGTSTYDGLSLAWALAEHLQKTKAKTLFATHFHEITALADEHSGVKNYNVSVKEWQDEIIFLHKIVEGSTDDSYGIYVAKLAGIPPEVINRAKKILTQLELKNNLKENLTGVAQQQQSQLDFFSTQPDPVTEKIISDIKAIDINNLAPLAALNEIGRLKKIINNA